jgi:hypothetical protein
MTDDSHGDAGRPRAGNPGTRRAPSRVPVGRIVEVAVFAPLGLAVTLREMAPTFVNMFVARGRAEVERRQQQVEQRVKTVRSTGEVALAFGLPVVRQKVARRLERVVPGAGGPAPKPAAGPPARRRSGAPPHPGGPASGSNGSRPQARDLPIPGYDELSAGQVVERLVGLSAAELFAVRDYEGAHRNRRTILGKIEQLAGA